MYSAIKPIDTIYAGCKFRSRLEARWAVFFDSLHVHWDYEPEGFQLPKLEWYLPDFYLPELDLWVEVKPGNAPKLWGEGKSDITYEQDRAMKLAQGMSSAGKNIVILYGTPRYTPFSWDTEDQIQHYSILGFIGDISHSVWKDGIIQFFTGFETLPEMLLDRGYDAPTYDHTHKTALELMELDKRYYRDEYGLEHPKWRYGITSHDLRWKLDSFGCLVLSPHYGEVYKPCNAVIDALNTASQERFDNR